MLSVLTTVSMSIICEDGLFLKRLNLIMANIITFTIINIIDLLLSLLKNDINFMTTDLYPLFEPPCLSLLLSSLPSTHIIINVKFLI